MIYIILLVLISGVYLQEPGGNSENGKKGQELYKANVKAILEFITRHWGKFNGVPDVPVIFSEVTHECTDCDKGHILYSFYIKLKRFLKADPTKSQWLEYVVYIQEEEGTKIGKALRVKKEEKKMTIKKIMDENIWNGFKEMTSPFNGEITDPRIKTHTDNIHTFIKDKFGFERGPDSKIISPNGRLYQCTNCPDVPADIFFPVKIDDKGGQWKNFLVYLKSPDTFDSVKNEEAGSTIYDIIEKEKEKLFKLVI